MTNGRRISETLGIALSIAAVTICCAASAVAQQQPESDAVVLRSLDEVRESFFSKPRAARRFVLEARISFKTATWRLFRLQFNGVSVQGKVPLEMLGDLSKINIGDLVRVSGVTFADENLLEVESIEIVARGDVSSLIAAPAFFDSGEPRYWKYVHYAGAVAEVLCTSEETQFRIEGEDGTIWCSYYSSRPVNPNGPLLGKWVRVHGYLLADNNPLANNLRRPRIAAGAPQQIVVSERSPPKKPGTSTRVSGFISHVADGYFVACGLKIKSSVCQSLKLDTTVEVDVIDLDSDSNEASAVSVNCLRGVKRPPLDLTDAEIIADGFMAHRVLVVHGTVSKCLVGKDRIELQLAQGDVVFTAIIPRNLTPSFAEVYGVGQTAAVTGAVVYRDNVSDERFALYVSNPADIVLSNPSFLLNRSQVAWGATALLACLTLAVGWHLTLRRRVAEKTKELSQLNARVVAAAAAVQNAILIVDNDDRAIQTNENFQQMFGRFHVGAHIDQIYENCIAHRFAHSSEFRNFWQRFPNLENGFGSQEFSIGESDGWISVTTASVPDDHGNAIGRVWTFEDITERRRLEQANMQTRKIEAVGRLAGGIAHDFNNLLQVVNANLETIKLTVCKGDEEATRTVELAAAAVDRGAALTGQLLSFSKGSITERRMMDINAIVTQVFALINCVLDANVTLSVELDDDVWQVNIDPGQLEQVLMNLCLNARDAIAEKQGRITISTRRGSGSQSEKSVVVTVEDDGCGMPEEIASQIFEPFFTTKDCSHGTGLGLSVAQGIIQQHSGRLVCSSTVGKGTQFELHLPGFLATTCDDYAVVEENEIVRERNAGGRILLVDDDSMVRLAGQLLLKTLGYIADVAVDGIDALEKLDGDVQYDVVILDMTMPRMSGKEALKRIRSLRPEAKIIVCSGYSEDAHQMSALNDMRPDGFLAKPFKTHELIQAIESGQPAGRELV